MLWNECVLSQCLIASNLSAIHIDFRLGIQPRASSLSCSSPDLFLSGRSWLQIFRFTQALPAILIRPLLHPAWGRILPAASARLRSVKWSFAFIQMVLTLARAAHFISIQEFLGQQSIRSKRSINYLDKRDNIKYEIKLTDFKTAANVCLRDKSLASNVQHTLQL